MTVALQEEVASLTALPQLLHPENYFPTTLQATYLPRAQLAARGEPTSPCLEDWIRIFKGSIASFQRTAAADPSVPELERSVAAAQFAARYAATLDALEGRGAAAAASGDPNAPPVTTCPELCRLREEALRAAGFEDIFKPIKALENQRALALLEGVCQEVDGMLDLRQRWEAVVRGVFAGNLFDLGAAASSEAYHQNGGLSFHNTREQLLPRPWVVDCLDALLDRLAASQPYRKAVLFVDNAGADVVLGMLPLARELLKRGTHVIIAANSQPSINDITAAELEALLPAICQVDCILCKGVSSQKLQVIASGSGLPVLDLTQVSSELVEAAHDADLIVLEGMGRSIETNLHARFSVDSLCLGMIKHPEVAQALGGRLYDCVAQFRRAGEP